MTNFSKKNSKWWLSCFCEHEWHISKGSHWSSRQRETPSEHVFHQVTLRWPVSLEHRILSLLDQEDEDYIRVEKKDKRKQHKNRLFCYIWQLITIVFVRWSQSAFTLYHYGLASSALLALFPEGVARLFPTPLFRQVMAVLQAVLLVVLGNMSSLLVVLYVGGARRQHVKFLIFSLWCCSTIYLSGIYIPLLLRCSESL